MYDISVIPSFAKIFTRPTMAALWFVWPRFPQCKAPSRDDLDNLNFQASIREIPSVMKQ